MAKLKEIQAANELDDWIVAGDDHDGDDDYDDDQHSRLIDAIGKLGTKKKLRVVQRTEPLAKVNEHALAQVADGAGRARVTAEDLLRAAGGPEKPKLAPLGKALKQARKRGVPLDAPLEKPEAQRVLRTVGYDKAKEEVSKWDSVVKSNRKAEQLIFPLADGAVKEKKVQAYGSNFKARTPLERQISQILAGSKHVHTPNEALTESEKQGLSAMSLKEALERRKELMRLRVLQSYQEAKARRQNKIKSKKYHRLLKRERVRNHAKEFEELKERDPDGALEQLEQLEKRRIEERMTLKHKGSGKWAKLQTIRAKYDDEARDALAEQLRMGRELTRKVQPVEEDSDDDPSSGAPILAVVSDNPWLGGAAAGAQGADMTTDAGGPGYRKIWSQSAMESAAANEQNDAQSGADSDGSDAESDEDAESVEAAEESDGGAELEPEHSEPLSEDLERKKELADFEASTPHDSGKGKDQSVAPHDSGKVKGAPAVESPVVEKKKPVDIDPNRFVTMTSTRIAGSSVPLTDHYASEDSGSDDDEDGGDGAAESRRMTLAEAFAEDDVVHQFGEEKKRVVDAGAPKVIDLTLPGWGDWGGSGLRVSKRKRKRFIIKPPPPVKRRDDNQGHLILNEDKSEQMRGRLVSELPFPFKSVAAFESTVRAPVTSTFVPETAARKMTAPKVIRKMGSVIEPMDRRVLVDTERRGKAADEDEDEPAKKKKKKSLASKTMKRPASKPSATAKKTSTIPTKSAPKPATKRPASKASESAKKTFKWAPKKKPKSDSK